MAKSKIVYISIDYEDMKITILRDSPSKLRHYWSIMKFETQTHDRFCKRVRRISDALNAIPHKVSDIDGSSLSIHTNEIYFFGTKWYIARREVKK